MKAQGITLWENVKNWLIRTLIIMVALWVISMASFRVLPVPFSMVMIERQLEAWFHGDVSYVAHSNWVDINNISSWMSLAVIAAEDQKFPNHRGLDIDAIASTVLHHKYNEKGPMRGASTLSQQTVKNLFLWSGRSWVRKSMEAGMTLVLEMVWNKPRILTVYLNIAEFGEGIFGVEAAAQHYFHKPASKLSAQEAALLAAVLPNPFRFKVSAPSNYVLKRQQWILRQMQQLGGQTFLIRHGIKQD